MTIPFRFQLKRQFLSDKKTRAVTCHFSLTPVGLKNQWKLKLAVKFLLQALLEVVVVVVLVY